MKKDQFLSMIKPDGGKYDSYYYTILYLIANNNIYIMYILILIISMLTDVNYV